ncbi:hypothetical protein BJ742DRAFT_570504 [Cladochytrium replicatum]|nr:hypothetical protein BJ742DRAFT_570504 [Cladochytrium replicatum]
MNISAPILISSTNPATPTDLRPTFARRILPAVSNPSSPSAPWACARNSMSGRVSDDPAHLCDLRTESEGTVVGGEDVESESGLRSVTKGSEKDVSSDIGLVEENLPEGESMVVNRPRRRRPKCLWLLASLVIVICVIVVMIPLTIKVMPIFHMCSH